MKAAASALELAAAADSAAAAGGGRGGRDFSIVARAEALAASLAPEPETKPGGGPGIYACDHREVASGLAALAKARLLLAKGGGGKGENEKNDGRTSAAAEAAAAGAAAKVLEKHELFQFRSAYMEPPRSQVPLAPCLGICS